MKLMGMLLGVILAAVFVSHWIGTFERPDATAYHGATRQAGAVFIEDNVSQDHASSDTPPDTRPAPPNPYAVILLAVGLAGLAVGHTRRI